jgi:hypothetical protein
MADDE